MSKSHASARVEFRIPEHLKQEIEEAAALMGVSLTAFAIQTLLERSREVKRGYAVTRMSDQERDAFLEMLASPPKPSDSLIKLMQT